MKNPLKRLLGMNRKSSVPPPMSHHERESFGTGIIRWFNPEKGFGFIAPNNGGPDIFCHYTSITGSGFRGLEEGQWVSYTVEVGPKGVQVASVAPL